MKMNDYAASICECCMGSGRVGQDEDNPNGYPCTADDCKANAEPAGILTANQRAIVAALEAAASQPKPKA